MMCQMLILQKILNSNKVKNLIIIYFFFLVLMINYVMNYANDINYATYDIILGNITIFDNNFLYLIWLLYNSLIVIYIQFIFLTYEFDNSLEFIILRKPMYINIFEKILTIIIFDIFYKFSILLLSYSFLSKYSPLNFNIVISNLSSIIFLSIITILIFLIYYICYNRK